MLSPKFFVESLRTQDLDFFAGVPDSLLKNFCAYLSGNIDGRHNIIAANEGAALSLAAGYHLATGKIGVVYMQNSGEGNIVNPLASLMDADVYNIPALLVIGWRGKPGVHDEPQHIKQGKITCSLLDVMGIKWQILSKEESQAARQITSAVTGIKADGKVQALVVEKDTFTEYSIEAISSTPLALSREEAVCMVADAMGGDDVAVSTTGMISRELFEFRQRSDKGLGRDFLTVGSMGHANQIALGISIGQPGRRVWCLDGDGAVIMHMGSLAIVARNAGPEYVHVVFNNGAHDSVGGQPTVGLDIDLPGIASSAGYKQVLSVSDKESLNMALRQISDGVQGPVFLEIRVCKGHRQGLGRPVTTPVQNKAAFMDFLSK